MHARNLVLYYKFIFFFPFFLIFKMAHNVLFHPYANYRYLSANLEVSEF